jgi:hypothetical protein
MISSILTSNKPGSSNRHPITSNLAGVNGRDGINPHPTIGLQLTIKRSAGDIQKTSGSSINMPEVFWLWSKHGVLRNL